MSMIKLSKAERVELRQRASRSGRADDARRARLILLVDAGHTRAEIRNKLSCSNAFIHRWCERFREARLDGLFKRHTRRRQGTLTPAHKHPLKPRRLHGHKASDDPDPEKNGADIIGLYLHPLQHAAVFCLAQRPPIHAQDRLRPMFPSFPGLVERDGFEPDRPGTLSLYAALKTRAAELLSQPAGHTPTEFVRFLTEIVVRQPSGSELHVIVDNLGAYKTIQAKDFLDAHCTVNLHFAPTYTSWLHQVDQWLARAARDVVHHGVLTSTRGTLLNFIRNYNGNAAIVKWKYLDPAFRITAKSNGTVH
jgi:hypothetical protein